MDLNDLPVQTWPERSLSGGCSFVGCLQGFFLFYLTPFLLRPYLSDLRGSKPGIGPVFIGLQAGGPGLPE
jgi:hypothetical protein